MTTASSIPETQRRSKLRERLRLDYGITKPTQILIRPDGYIAQKLEQRVQRPRPRLGHVVAAVEAGWEEEPGVAELGAVVDLVADPLAPGRAYS